MAMPEPKNKPLVSLEDHNTKQRDLYARHARRHAKPNGIACPDCGRELVDTSPNFTLLSVPPKKHVGCNRCGYRGYCVV